MSEDDEVAWDEVDLSASRFFPPLDHVKTFRLIMNDFMCLNHSFTYAHNIKPVDGDLDSDVPNDEEDAFYKFDCPCGDVFKLTLGDALDLEDIATCDSCSLLLRVRYSEADVDDFQRRVLNLRAKLSSSTTPTTLSTAN